MWRSASAGAVRLGVRAVSTEPHLRRRTVGTLRTEHNEREKQRAGLRILPDAGMGWQTIRRIPLANQSSSLLIEPGVSRAISELTNAGPSRHQTLKVPPSAAPCPHSAQPNGKN